MSGAKGGRSGPLCYDDARSLRRIRDWLKTVGGNELEIDILEELSDRVDSHIKNAAIFRVRLLNHPDPNRMRKAKVSGKGIEWSEEEIDQLHRLFFEGLTIAEISERMGNRTQFSIVDKIHRLGLRRKRPNGLAMGNGGKRRWEEKGVLARARQRRDEIKAEAISRREGVA